jgi:hypothetical protein
VRSCNFLRLIYNNVTSRSYGYFLKYSYFDFLRNWFFQLCQKLQSLVKKTQRILGVKSDYNSDLQHFFIVQYWLLQVQWASSNKLHFTMDMNQWCCFHCIKRFGSPSLKNAKIEPLIPVSDPYPNSIKASILRILSTQT